MEKKGGLRKKSLNLGKNYKLFVWFVDLVDTTGIRYSILVPYLRFIPERMPPL